MSDTAKPTNAPTSTRGGKTDTELQRSAAARQQFFAAAANMSWQLAIVVLVPVIGGFKLDQHLHSAPLWTITGFGLAIIGMGMVVWRQLQLFSPPITPADIESAKKIRDAEGEDL